MDKTTSKINDLISVSLGNDVIQNLFTVREKLV